MTEHDYKHGRADRPDTPRITAQQRLAQRRRDRTMLYREAQEIERRCRAPIVLTPQMIEAGITEEKARRAREMQRRDAWQQYELANRRIHIMTRCAVRRAPAARPVVIPRSPARRPRQRRPHRRVARSTASSDSGDDPASDPPGERRHLAAEVVP